MKKITRRSFLAVCGTVAAAAALTACGGSASSATASTASSAAGSTAAGTLSGNVATGGSTSMKNVIAALTEGFAEVEPGVTVSYDPTGSGAGITGATDKTLDIGLSSRALKDDEKNAVDGTTVALDRIKGRMPNFGSAAVEAHSVPSRNRNRPILWMAGTPERTMYTVMSTTQPTASMPHRKKMKFIIASSQSAGVRGSRTRAR